MKNQIILIISLTVISVIGLFFLQQNFNILQQSDISLDDIQEVIHDVSTSDSLSVILIGDTGTGLEPQKKVADYLNKIAEQENAQFLLGLGDNFYENGVSGLDDPGWNNKWADVYQNKSYLKDLTWYGTLGNHDYGGSGMYSEFQYNKYGWKLQDFFWTHTAQVGDQKIAFIHIDTDFLAYGIQGESSKPLMKDYFVKQGWTNNEQILQLVQEQLKKYSDYDWKIVMGHHPIGYVCSAVLNTNLLYDILDSNGVDAYFSGHSHQLAYTQYEKMGFLLSGAASKSIPDECAESNPMWSKGHIYGFMNFKIKGDIMDVTAYYVDELFLGEWQTHSLPPLVKRSAKK